MIDTKLQKTGTLLMHDGRIYTSGFSANGCMCREVGALKIINGVDD